MFKLVFDAGYAMRTRLYERRATEVFICKRSMRNVTIECDLTACKPRLLEICKGTCGLRFLQNNPRFPETGKLLGWGLNLEKPC